MCVCVCVCVCVCDRIKQKWRSMFEDKYVYFCRNSVDLWMKGLDWKHKYWFTYNIFLFM